MNAPAPSRRAVGLAVGAVLVIVGAVLASIAVFGGSAVPDNESRPSTAQPSTAANKPQGGPRADPTAEASCLLYDFECQAEGGSAVVPRQPPPGGAR
ncbi:hypothetical protein AB0I84_22915 [Streptomyces spectabilis]|uniref:hypothetical protein n=1 Tax=Streptomyces spectabilis TaxID=68270 RepID=UPI0033FF1922